MCIRDRSTQSTWVRTRIRNLCIKLHDHSTDRELLLKERQEIDNMSIESNEEFLESIITAQSTGENGTKEVDSPTKKSTCLLYTSPSPRDGLLSRMPSSA
eukprot:TRINITY_DN8759_c0_g1_i1.p2 TRINITY_DN8759_c0_g1~~TRINITY_DN8759_c0_g1_i1.p2  ORF type:complete len:100 (+),score=28.06 TRINITY_DN8759_c0_g1_i1:64-363(+)